MEEKAINEGAEYIILNKDGHKIYVDMYDIDDILPVQEVIFQGTNKKGMIYTVMFKDKSFWQIIMDDEDLTIFKNSTMLLQELAAFLIENSSPSETSGRSAISSVDIFLKVNIISLSNSEIFLTIWPFSKQSFKILNELSGIKFFKILISWEWQRLRIDVALANLEFKGIESSL